MHEDVLLWSAGRRQAPRGDVGRRLASSLSPSEEASSHNCGARQCVPAAVAQFVQRYVAPQHRVRRERRGTRRRSKRPRPFCCATISMGGRWLGYRVGTDGRAISGDQLLQIAGARMLIRRADLLIIHDVFGGPDAATDERLWRAHRTATDTALIVGLRPPDHR